MRIKCLNDIIIPEIKNRNENDFVSTVLNDVYYNDELLVEAHEMSKILMPLPPNDDMYWEIPPADFSGWRCCDIFGYRYTRGIVKGQKNIKNKYLNDYNIISTLLAFDIDPIQFWYVLMITKDYIDDKTTDVPLREKTPKESFMELCDELLPENKDNDEYDDFVDLYKKKCILRLTCNGKKKVEIRNPETLRLLCIIIKDYIRKHSFERSKNYDIRLDSLNYVYDNIDDAISPLSSPTPYQPSHLAKIYLFNRYMMEYLKNYKGRKNLCIKDLITSVPSEIGNHKISVNKEIFISRLLCLIEYADEKTFCNNSEGIMKDKPIKDALRKYNTSEIKKLSTHNYRL